jgi:site-specific recombinase XerD
MWEDEDAFRRYLEVERGLAPASVTAYIRDVRSFLADAQFRSGSPTEDLRAWLYAHAGAASTVTRRLAAIRCWARFAGIADPTLDVARPKRRQGLPRPVDDLTDRLKTMDALTRWAAVLLSETGLRLSEACALKCTVPPPEEVLVHGKGGKERLVPLTSQARRALTVLGGSIPWSPRQLQRRFSRYGFTPHQLRHTFASELAESGADLGEIQDLLGHASPATTRVYAAYSRDRLRRAVERRTNRA